MEHKPVTVKELITALQLLDKNSKVMIGIKGKGICAETNLQHIAEDRISEP